ncbi:hypothetical protein HPT29_017370 [Microvirga terrae]|uniref:Uncharacterized protein n=1 Tax=Microvirga terrae TaxID=2740529 RepID=A0ABY5RM14_9HYPH|nr:hypothetical protein [Microvirga terrae]UVF18271.1 hypothetical protein HPT29_017370 [Microvirga terrae]
MRKSPHVFDGEALSNALSLTMVAMATAPGFSPLLGSALDASSTPSLKPAAGATCRLWPVA